MVSRADSTSFFPSALKAGCQGRAEREVEILLAKYYRPLTGGCQCGTLFAGCRPCSAPLPSGERVSLRAGVRDGSGGSEGESGAGAARIVRRPAKRTTERPTDQARPAHRFFRPPFRRPPILSPGATPRILAAQAATRAAAECLQAAAK